MEYPGTYTYVINVFFVSPLYSIKAASMSAEAESQKSGIKFVQLAHHSLHLTCAFTWIFHSFRHHCGNLDSHSFHNVLDLGSSNLGSPPHRPEAHESFCGIATT